jgi:DNA processing protein
MKAMPMYNYIPNPSLKNEAVIDVLRLIRSEHIGPMTFYQLIKFCGSAKKAIEMAPEMSKRGGRKKPLHIISKSQAEKEILAVKNAGAQMVMYGQDSYPRLLQTLSDAPPLLTISGNAHLLSDTKMLGVVGARNASANGCALTKKLVKNCADAGCIIVSGLARGIDTAAHQASLKTGTIAIMAGGIDSVYPPENAGLFDDIKNLGVVVCEAPFGSKPLARHFPARNRIIAGMSHGVLVVEASLKSGSLITANYANDYGRDVFSVPGSPLDPRCKGTNKLLREGAYMAECAQDILSQISAETNLPLAESGQDHFPLSIAEATHEHVSQRMQDTILQALGFHPTSFDELLANTGLSPHIVLAVILELELAGKARRLPGGQVTLIAGDDNG